MRSQILILILLSSCTFTLSNESEDDSIKVFLETYYSEMSKRDWKKYENFFWDDATITTIWQKPGDSVSRVHVITIKEFIAEAPNGPDSKPIFSEEMTGVEIEVRGNIGVARANYKARFGDVNAVMEWNGRDVFTLLKFDGAWKIVSLVFEQDN
jgi:hypothetical protein